jgi:hypothetical protein
VDLQARTGLDGRQGVRGDPDRGVAVAAPGCDLCEARRFTTWYFEDDRCWIADCEICEVPMVVWRLHGDRPPDEVRDHLLAMLRRVADERFGPGGYRIDEHMRNIPDHFHAHARDLAFWTRFAGGARARRPIPDPTADQP